MQNLTYAKTYDYRNEHYFGLVQTICGTRILTTHCTRIARASKERALCDAEDMINQMKGDTK